MVGTKTSGRWHGPNSGLTKYEAHFPDIAFKVLSEGGSLAKVCKELGVCRETLSHWRNPKHPNYHPELHEAIEVGLPIAQVLWEEKGESGMTDKNFNAGIYIHFLKKRFRQDYGDHVMSDEPDPLSSDLDGGVI